MKKKIKKQEDLNLEIQNIINAIEENNEYVLEIPSESFAQYMVLMLNRQKEGVEYSYYIKDEKYVLYMKIAQNRLFSIISMVFVGVIIMLGIVILTQKSTLVNF
ncbi:MAG: hypothetical protein ACRCXX_12700 [Cetobacterium sp.]|uniref:hypothetical protein n=1 Tax=Cetobacterium sp. TaxID=2071632 RepID=UPI003F38158D